ncbi:secreted RxLR effector protein 161-like [Macadamia integrifolia]|uniref:secreted RxLR effector protein 161-like n=1 Tax=Macadamia integrifolia TaxID=60698 RepID=UPI001C4E74A5|nr:secreted RxLR effector protein 161-like [Macadamia integrifolia]
MKSFNISQYLGGDAYINKGDKLNKHQYRKTGMERSLMVDKPYALVIGSLMYAKVYTHPDIAFMINVLGRRQLDASKAHWTTTKKVMRYLQRIKDFKLVYSGNDRLEVIGYYDFDFNCCTNDSKSTSGYIFLMGSGAISWRSAK